MGIWLNRLLFLTNIAILGLSLYFICSRGYVEGAGWTGPELVTIILTALAVLITVLGIFIAVLAIWGYSRISDDARIKAEATSLAYLGENVSALVQKEVSIHIGGADIGSAAGGKEGGNGSGD